MNIPSIARALGGEVCGQQVLCPGPGHSRKDRSLAVRISRDGEILVHSFSGDDWRECRDYVKDRLGLPGPELAQRRPGARREPLYQHGLTMAPAPLARGGKRPIFEGHLPKPTFGAGASNCRKAIAPILCDSMRVALSGKSVFQHS